MLQAQNLVPNPSFEDTIACPIGINQVEDAVGWINFRSSPDYYNSCATPFSHVSVPSNSTGYQCPANGNAYCGFIPYTTGFNNYREFLGIELLNPLVTGQKYYVSFKVSLSNQCICGCNKLGALFSTVKFPLDTFGNNPLNNFSHVYTNGVITDTVNWTTIFGSFVTDSAYKYIMIGNFFDDANTDTIRFYPVTGCSVYYFIDDVCVSTDSLTCEIPNGPNVCDTGVYIFETNLSKESIAIYPNPSNDYVHIMMSDEADQIYSCTIFNAYGNRIRQLKNPSTVDVSDLPDGIYLFQIRSGYKIINKKIIIN
jgi:hypothetical protein